MRLYFTEIYLSLQMRYMYSIQSIRQQSTISISAFDRDVLLAYVLKTSREYIIAHPETKLSVWQYSFFLCLVYKRKKGYPVAYLTHQKSFFGLDFFVNKHTLVPRPDTECMVELAISHITKHQLQDSSITLIDIGTGSGCIPISILSTLQHQSSVCILHARASDISRQAITIAKRNATKHTVDITFKQGRLLKPWISELTRNSSLTSHIIITANLPYITEQQWKNEPSIQREPKSALVACEQGLALYRELLAQVSELQISTPLTIFFEIDPSQAIAIPSLVHEYVPTASITIHKDLQGHDRIVVIKV